MAEVDTGDSGAKGKHKGGPKQKKKSTPKKKPEMQTSSPLDELEDVASVQKNELNQV